MIITPIGDKIRENNLDYLIRYIGDQNKATEKEKLQ